MPQHHHHRKRSADHYRMRAQQLRGAADHAADHVARATLLDLAEQYDDMAETSEGEHPRDMAPLTLPRGREASNA